MVVLVDDDGQVYCARHTCDSWKNPDTTCDGCPMVVVFKEAIDNLLLTP